MSDIHFHFRSGVLTYGKAAKLYNIPKTTLYRNRRCVEGFMHIGQTSLLGQHEENSLASYMR